MTAQTFSLHADGVPVRDWVPRGEGCFYSPSCSLEVRCTVRSAGAAAIHAFELVNPAPAPSPLLSRIVFYRDERPVDPAGVPVILHSGGGLTDAVFPSAAWRAQRTELVDWSALKLEGAKGRSANRDLPIFLVTDEEDRRGVAYVAGYMGNVVSTILREQDYASVSVSMGVRDLCLRIPPGETVPVGSVLVLPYEGNADAGANALRRVLREHVCPPSSPKVVYDHWFGIERHFDEALLLKELDVQARIGTEVFVVDAAWARQGKHAHYGAGNWEQVDTQKFPRGLKAFADDVRARGLAFGLWIEPETVEEGTALERDLAAFLLRKPGAYRALLDFGRPEVVDRLFDITCRLVDEVDVAWFRVDSNLDPEAYWAEINDPGERGYRELRHFAGYRTYLDRLRARYPHLHLEGCSSGGRRIDLEMLARHHSFWVSDNTVFPVTVHQHVGGANRFLPSHLIHTEMAKYPRFAERVPYAARDERVYHDFWLATLCGGLFGIGEHLAPCPPALHARVAEWIARYKQLRVLLAGDFQPLLPQPTRTDQWDAWQFHDPAAQRGFVIAFRMRGGPMEMNILPRGLQADAIYTWRSVDTVADLVQPRPAVAATAKKAPFSQRGGAPIRMCISEAYCVDIVLYELQ
jgi:alpha-galactosidase